jgi:hypothetical protein
LTLSERAWKHIRERHPELSNYEGLIRDALASPEIILKGKWQERKAVKLFTKTHLGSKYLVVVYREENGKKVIITAYFISDLKRVKGEPMWKA